MRLIALFLTLFAALPAAAQELPMLADDALAEWQAVGRVNTRGYNRRGMCSGVLIGPDMVLTAAHCVAGPDGNPVGPADLHFVAGWLGGDYAADSAVAGYEVHPDAYARVTLSIEHDLALLTLSAPIETVPPLPLGHRLSPPFAVIGYHDHRPHRLSGRLDCGGWVDHALLRLTCPVRPGNSGGPVLTQEDGVWRVIAVVSAAAQGGALAVPLDEWLRERVLRGSPYKP